MKRRNLLLGMAASASAAALPSFTGLRAQSGGRVVFNGAGGSWQKNARQAWLTPFTEATGIDVVDVFPFDIGRLSAMVGTGTAEWDVTDIPAAMVGTAIKEELLETIDYGIINREGLPPEMFGEHYVVYGHFANLMIANSKRFTASKKPQSWTDYWDVERFSGPRTFRKLPSPQLEFALIADGVALDQLYPLDLARAFRKLDEIKPHVRWWTSGAQSIQLVADREADMGTTFSGRATTARKQGVPIEINWNQAGLASLYFVVPKGAKNKDNAMRLINFIVQAAQQAKMANLNRTSPANSQAFAQIDAAIAPDLPTAPAHRSGMFHIDDSYWWENLGPIKQRFDEWLLEA